MSDDEMTEATSAGTGPERPRYQMVLLTACVAFVLCVAAALPFLARDDAPVEVSGGAPPATPFSYQTPTAVPPQAVILAPSTEDVQDDASQVLGASLTSPESDTNSSTRDAGTDAEGEGSAGTSPTTFPSATPPPRSTPIPPPPPIPTATFAPVATAAPTAEPSPTPQIETTPTTAPNPTPTVGPGTTPAPTSTATPEPSPQITPGSVPDPLDPTPAPTPTLVPVPATPTPEAIAATPPPPAAPTPTVAPVVGLAAPGCPAGFSLVSSQAPSPGQNGVSVCMRAGLTTFGPGAPARLETITWLCTSVAPANSVAWFHQIGPDGQLSCGYWLTANGVLSF